LCSKLLSLNRHEVTAINDYLTANVIAVVNYCDKVTIPTLPNTSAIYSGDVFSASLIFVYSSGSVAQLWRYTNYITYLLTS